MPPMNIDVSLCTRQIASRSVNQRSPVRQISACCASKSPAMRSCTALARLTRGLTSVPIATRGAYVGDRCPNGPENSPSVKPAHVRNPILVRPGEPCIRLITKPLLSAWALYDGPTG